jgi:hypothetical protein
MLRGRQILGRLGLTLTICVSLSACAASLQQISSAQRAAIEAEKTALVLFRLTARVDQEIVAPLTDSGNFIRIDFDLANLEGGEPVRTITADSSDVLVSLSPDAASQGWGAFALGPGTYYFLVRARSNKWIQPADLPQMRFRFTVSPENKPIYIGSLRLDCIAPSVSTWFGPRRGTPKCSWENPVPFDESEDAAIMARDVADMPAPVTELMQSYYTPLQHGQLAALSPVGVLVSGSAQSDLQSPEWMSRAMQRGLGYGLAPSALLLAVLGSGGGGGGPGAGAVLGLAVMWAPVGATLGGLGGYIGGKWSESRFEPCRKSLRESLSELEPDAVLRKKLTATLGNRGIPLSEVNLTQETATSERNQVQLGSIIDARIQRIALRHCQVASQTLCVDVAVRARVIEARSNNAMYDAVLLYGREELQPYELRAYSSESTPGHEVESICGENGIETFHGEIARALDAIVDGLVGDFGLRNE